MKIPVSSVNGGEATPLLLGRPDLESLRRACVKLRNFIPRVFGAAFRRPSLMHLGMTSDPTKHHRLIDFKFSVSVRYQLELGDYTIRFWNVSTGALEGSADTPWSADEIDDVKFAQVNDVMFFVHPEHPPQELLRKVDGWEFREEVFKYPAFRDEVLRDDDGSSPVATDLLRVDTTVWPQTGFHGSTGTVYTFSVGWVGGSGTKTATLQRWTGTAWSTLKTFSWTGTSYTNSWVYTVPSPTNLQAVRITYSGPVASTSGFARYSSAPVGSPGTVTHMLNMNLAVSQPLSRQSVVVPAGAEWRAEIDATTWVPSTSLLYSGYSLTVQRLSGSTWVNVATMPITAGLVSTYNGSVRTSNTTYRLLWAGNQLYGGTMAIQTLVYSALSDITLAVSATSGSSRTMTASAALFNADHVGSRWRIRHRRTLATVSRVGAVGAFSGYSDPLMISNGYSFTTYGRWSGTVHLEIKLPNGTFETLRSWSGNKDRNITVAGNVASGSIMRIWAESCDGASASDAAVPRFVLESADASHDGLVTVTGYTSPTVVTVDVTRDLFATTATRYWNEGSWSKYRGYPRSVTVHQQRVIYGGNKSQPQVIWGSVIGDLRNFETGVLDDMGFTYLLAAEESNPIQWMVSLNGLIVGTEGEEWLITAEQGAITPSNVKVERQSRNGSESIQAVLAESAILFVQRGGLNVREYIFAFERQTYVSPILTQLVEHLTRSGIRTLCHTVNPEQMLWAVTNDGKLLCCSYRREEEVVAWSVIETEGEVEWVSPSYGDKADEVWVIVRRDNTTRVERIDAGHWERIESGNSWHLDAAVRVTGTDLTEVTGLEHLEGNAVKIFADGYRVSDALVVDGKVTLPIPASEVVVGLKMTSILQPWPIFLNIDDGTTMGRKMHIKKLTVRFHRTGAASYRSAPGEKLYEIPFRTPQDPMDGPVPLFSGFKILSLTGSYNEETQYLVETDSPLPLNVLSMVPNVGVYGD
jgi:hypothetical protein